MEAPKEIYLEKVYPDNGVLPGGLNYMEHHGEDDIKYIRAELVELTWEDVAKIITIYEEGIDNGDYRRYNEAEWMKEYSQDILRRFNEQRKK